MIWFFNLSIFLFEIFSQEFQTSLGAMNDVLKTALDEIDEYCEYNKWLNEINIYCKKWTDKSVKELRGEAAFTIEVCTN